MGETGLSMMLYSSQSQTVWGILHRDGVCFSKREYVQQKYEESAPIFLTVYDWFCSQAQKLLPRPEGAEYPYWAFRDLYSVSGSPDNQIRQLQVPAQEGIYFDVYDWNRLLTLQYLGENQEDEANFRRTLQEYGVRRPADVMLTNFYPDLKRQVLESWKRLFRHHARILAGDDTGVGSVQAALWQLREEWICPNGQSK